MSGLTGSPSTSSSSSASTSYPSKPRCVGAPRQSRSKLLLASVGVSALFFLLDTARVGQGSGSAELCCYVTGLLVAILYMRFVDTRRSSTAKQQVDIRERLSALCDLARVKAKAAQAKVQAFADTVRRLRLTPPEGPVFSAQVVRATAALLATLLVPMFILPFLADMSGEASACDRMAVFDAAPKLVSERSSRPGLSIPSTTWLVVAFLMSSGLCAVHPLQSGLLMTF